MTKNLEEALSKAIEGSMFVRDADEIAANVLEPLSHALADEYPAITGQPAAWLAEVRRLAQGDANESFRERAERLVANKDNRLALRHAMRELEFYLADSDSE